MTDEQVNRLQEIRDWASTPDAAPPLYAIDMLAIIDTLLDERDALSSKLTKTLEEHLEAYQARDHHRDSLRLLWFGGKGTARHVADVLHERELWLLEETR